ncbi:MAG: tetratricopeptide repeat protein [Sphingomicrobium sp.]
MALPADSSETFLREVDENLRRDRTRDLAKKHGKWLVLAVVLFLAAVGGWLYWQDRLRQQSAAQSEELSKVFGDIGAGQAAAAPARLQPLEGARSDAIRASAMLAQAAVALERNDRPTALAKYRALSADGGLPQVYRDVGLLRATAIEFDQLAPAEVIARLQPLVKPGEPWFGSAGELTGMAYIKMNQPAKAGRLFAQIAADRQVPETLRSRAVQIAGTLGVDASASLPAAAN